MASVLFPFGHGGACNRVRAAVYLPLDKARIVDADIVHIDIVHSKVLNIPLLTGRAAVYTPCAFQDDDLASMHATMRAARLSNLITATTEGLIATPLPLVLDEAEGKYGVLYGHVAKANPQWKTTPIGEAMAIFSGPDAYITPSWYATKRETGKVVPTWNYVAVHAYGPAEFFDDLNRLLEAVTRLTNLYEGGRAEPWSVSDAPAEFIVAQLRGIVGVRLPITRIEGKRKLSQNRNEADRKGVAAGLAESECAADRTVAGLIPTWSRLISR